MRIVSVSEPSAAFAAQYAERMPANGMRPSIDETLTRCPRLRSLKCGTMACIP